MYDLTPISPVRQVSIKRGILVKLQIVAGETHNVWGSSVQQLPFSRQEIVVNGWPCQALDSNLWQKETRDHQGRTKASPNGTNERHATNREKFDAFPVP
jgi:hypothetical protein